MQATLPAFSRGLRLVRGGVLLMLLQLALTLVAAVMAAIDRDDPLAAIEWTQHLLLASAAATLLMCAGAARGIAELRGARIEARALWTAVIAFAVATGCVAWTYHVIADVTDLLSRVLADDDGALAGLEGAIARLEHLSWFVIAKDLAYAIGLLAVLRVLREAASAHDQLYLRDAAASMSRAVIVMLVGDVFYQLTYGLGTGGGPLGMVGSLLIAGYWVRCHLRLHGFLGSAAYSMHEPGVLPSATVLRAAPDAPAARASRPALATPPAIAPGAPAAPPALAIAPAIAPAPTPRAAPDAAGDEPSLLR